MKKLMFLLVLILILLLINCNSNNNAITENEIEKVVVETIVRLIGTTNTVYMIATHDLIGQYSNIVFSILEYDESTGEWTVKESTDFGYSVEFTMKLTDSRGKTQKYYNRLTTYKVFAKGYVKGQQGSGTFDVTIMGLNAFADTITINGSGKSECYGYEADITIKNLVVDKEGDFYPESGSIIVEVEDCRVAVMFSGNEVVKATFSYNGKSITFYINLKTGEISY